MALSAAKVVALESFAGAEVPHDPGNRGGGLASLYLPSMSWDELRRFATKNEIYEGFWLPLGRIETFRDEGQGVRFPLAL